MAEQTKSGTGHTATECCGGTDCTSQIREHMDVIASCGKKLGVVDHVEGTSIKLTKKDSPDGQHHFIPTDWVARVDQHVHLKKNSEEACGQWGSAPVTAGG
jgi:hypothetical protein